MTLRLPVYLDNQATTPLDPRVLDAMLPFLREKFGNPHSVDHRYGWEAADAVEEARKAVAALVHGDPKALFFTSGATEANNLAIKGVMEAMAGTRPHLVVAASEHKCVLESARAMERRGCRLTLLPVDERGLIDLAALDRAVGEDTALVSVMAVNNEIGVIQPLAEIGALCRARGAYFHCDAAQGFGKIPLDVEAMRIDLMSISGHKIYGPKGVGALWIRRVRPRVRIVPQMSGGGQETGMRSGTLAPALCVGLGAAARIAGEEMAQEATRVRGLHDRFRSKIMEALPDTRLNGDAERRWPGNLNLAFPGVDGEMLMAGMRDLAVSSGAACASAETGPSHVLDAIGLPRELARASIRFGLGRFTTDEEVDFAAARAIAAVRELHA